MQSAATNAASRSGELDLLEALNNYKSNSNSQIINNGNNNNANNTSNNLSSSGTGVGSGSNIREGGGAGGVGGMSTSSKSISIKPALSISIVPRSLYSEEITANLPSSSNTVVKRNGAGAGSASQLNAGTTSNGPPSLLLREFAMLDGLIYAAGTVIPVHTRFGPDLLVRNVINRELVPLDEYGTLTLRKGDFLELVDPEQLAVAHSNSGHHSQHHGGQMMVNGFFLPPQTQQPPQQPTHSSSISAPSTAVSAPNLAAPTLNGAGLIRRLSYGQDTVDELKAYVQTIKRKSVSIHGHQQQQGQQGGGGPNSNITLGGNNNNDNQYMVSSTNGADGSMGPNGSNPQLAASGTNTTSNTTSTANGHKKKGSSRFGSVKSLQQLFYRSASNGNNSLVGGGSGNNASNNMNNSLTNNNSINAKPTSSSEDDIITGANSTNQLGGASNNASLIQQTTKITSKSSNALNTRQPSFSDNNNNGSMLQSGNNSNYGSVKRKSHDGSKVLYNIAKVFGSSSNANSTSNANNYNYTNNSSVFGQDGASKRSSILSQTANISIQNNNNSNNPNNNNNSNNNPNNNISFSNNSVNSLLLSHRAANTSIVLQSEDGIDSVGLHTIDQVDEGGEEGFGVGSGVQEGEGEGADTLSLDDMLKMSPSGILASSAGANNAALSNFFNNNNNNNSNTNTITSADHNNNNNTVGRQAFQKFKRPSILGPIFTSPSNNNNNNNGNGNGSKEASSIYSNFHPTFNPSPPTHLLARLSSYLNSSPITGFLTFPNTSTTSNSISTSLNRYYFLINDNFLCAYSLDEQQSLTMAPAPSPDTFKGMVSQSKPVFRFLLDGCVAIQNRNESNSLQLINGGILNLICESEESKLNWIANINSLASNLSFYRSILASGSGRQERFRLGGLDIDLFPKTPSISAFNASPNNSTIHNTSSQAVSNNNNNNNNNNRNHSFGQATTLEKLQHDDFLNNLDYLNERNNLHCELWQFPLTLADLKVAGGALDDLEERTDLSAPDYALLQEAREKYQLEFNRKIVVLDDNHSTMTAAPHKNSREKVEHFLKTASNRYNKGLDSTQTSVGEMEDLIPAATVPLSNYGGSLESSKKSVDDPVAMHESGSAEAVLTAIKAEGSSEMSIKLPVLAISLDAGLNITINTSSFDDNDKADDDQKAHSDDDINYVNDSSAISPTSLVRMYEASDSVNASCIQQQQQQQQGVVGEQTTTTSSPIENIYSKIIPDEEAGQYMVKDSVRDSSKSSKSLRKSLSARQVATESGPTATAGLSGSKSSFKRSHSDSLDIPLDNTSKHGDGRLTSLHTQTTSHESGKIILRRVSSDTDGKTQLVYRFDADAPHDSGIITAGTLNKLVDILADERKQDPSFVEIFLLCHRHIIRSEDLMKNLLRKLHLVLPADPPQGLSEYLKIWQPIIILRAASIVRLWMQRYFVDFRNEEMKRLFKMFTLSLTFPKIALDEKENPEIYRSCILDLRRTSVLLNKIFQKQSSIITSIPVQKERPKLEFLQLDLVELKKALLTVQQEKFCAIKPVEYVIYLWDSKKKNATTSSNSTNSNNNNNNNNNNNSSSEIHNNAAATVVNSLTLDNTIGEESEDYRNLLEMINYFNTVSFWVTTEIVTQPQLKPRIQTVERFIKLAKECRKLNNFNLVVAILSGLNNSSTTRLKQTWEGLSQKYISALNDLEALVSPELNYRHYRNALELVETQKEKICCTPFFGLFIKDIVFLNDGNPKHLENGLVNFGKLRMIADRIRNISKYQSLRYNFQVDDVLLDYVRNLRALKEAALYKYSLLCEGRNGEERLIDKWAKDHK